MREFERCSRNCLVMTRQHVRLELALNVLRQLQRRHSVAVFVAWKQTLESLLPKQLTVKQKPQIIDTNTRKVTVLTQHVADKTDGLKYKLTNLLGDRVSSLTTQFLKSFRRLSWQLIARMILKNTGKYTTQWTMWHSG